MKDPTKMTTVIIFESKKYVSRSKHSNKEVENVMFQLKKVISNKKHIAQMDFAEYLRKSEGSENSKVYYGRLLRNGLHERYC